MLLHRFAAIVLIAVSCLWAEPRAEPPNSILMITDVEGVGGVCRQEQTDPTRPETRKLLTGEVNAAVRGFLAAGAGEVVVWDGHDGSRTLSVLTIDPRAKLAMGHLGPNGLLDRHFAALAFVGQHARANSKRGVMAHSESSLGIQYLRMNGKPVGEIELWSALAGWFDTPVIFLSGDQAAADNLHAIVPNAEVAVVKEGLSYYSCISLSATAAQKLIEKQAAKAFAKIGKIRPYKITGPVTIEMQVTTRHTPPLDEPLPPGAKFVDARTILYSGKNFYAAWMSWEAR